MATRHCFTLCTLCACVTLALTVFAPTARGGTIYQRPGEDFVAFEAEEVEPTSLPGSRWRVVDLVTPYPNPSAQAKTPLLLPPTTNASRGAALLADFSGSITANAVFTIHFDTPGTYYYYTRDGAYENAGDPNAYGNEDSHYRPLDFNIDPDTGNPDCSYHGFSGQTEGQYGWRNGGAGRTYTVSAAGDYEFRIRFRESGFSLDRIIFSQVSNHNLTNGELDALLNWNLSETHFTDADPGDSNWSTAGNWDNGMPTANSVAFIGDGKTATLSATGAKADRLSIGHDNATLPGDGTLNQTGGDLAITQLLQIGVNSAGTGNVTGTYVASGGSLAVGTPTIGRADLYVGRHTSTGNNNATGTLDLSGASQFDAYLAKFEIGNRTTSSTSSGAAAGTVTLSPLNNIDAKTILVSESYMWATIPQSKLLLGAVNNIKTDTLTVAGFRGNALVDFAPGVTGGVLNLSGSSGAEADLRVGYCHLGTGTATTGVLDLTGGTFNATLDDLVIAYRVARGEYDVTTNGTMSFDAGAVTANSVTIGWGTTASDGTIGRGIGTLNMGGGTLAVSGDLALARGTTGSQGTLNMTGGTLTVTGDVNEGPDPASGTSTLNIDGGTMNVAGDLDVDNLQVGHNGRTASVSVAGDVNVGSSLIVGRRSSNSVNSGVLTDGTLDLSGASSVTVNVDDLYVVQSTSDHPVNGTLTLSTTGPNEINAARIYLGSLNVGSIPDAHAVLHLGQDNTIRTDTFRAGYLKGFADVDIVAGGTLELIGLSGAGADLRIGDVDTATGTNPKPSTMDLTGGTFNATLDELVIGYHLYPWTHTVSGSGTGTLSFDAGTVTANSVAIGRGEVDPPNATYPNPAEGRGVGTLNMGGGTLDVAGSLGLGVGSPRAQGTLNLSGGILNVSGNVTGGPGASTLNVDGGTLAVAGDLKVDTLRVGYNGGTGSASAGGDVVIGASGNLRVGYRDSTTTNPANSTVGTLDLTGADSVDLDLDALEVGVLAVNSDTSTQGTLSLSTEGTSTVSATTITIGHSAAGYTPTVRGTVHLGTDNTIEADTVYVGRQKAQGEMDIVPGGMLSLTGLSAAEATLRVGYNDTTTGSDVSRGTLDLSGGTFNATLGELTIGYHDYPWSGTTGKVEGVMTYDAGTVTADTVTIGKGNPPGGSAVAGGGGTGTLNLHGGTLNAQTVLLGVGGSDRARGTLNMTGGTMTVDGVLQLSEDNSNATATFNFSGGTLSVYSTQKGARTVVPEVAHFNWTGGTLHVDIFGLDLVQDNDNPEDNLSVLAPGRSIGMTDIAGDYTMHSNSTTNDPSTLEIEINSRDQGDRGMNPVDPGDLAGDGFGYDFVMVHGDATLDGDLLVLLIDGYAPDVGDYFDVLQTTGTLDFTGLTLTGDLAGAHSWSMQHVALANGDSVLRLTAVPEPSGVLLAGLGLLALLGCAWRRRFAAATRRR